jgi:UDP-N-acetylglucosamine 2-epimerase (non-hydrolysing)
MQPKQTLSSVTSKMIDGLDKVINEVRPDIVLAHGDNATSFCAALSAFYNKIPVGHVEAGLRSGDRLSPFPEETMRVLTDNLSTLYFSPTKSNAENLYKENIKDNIYITGNTVIDALHLMVKDNYNFKSKDLQGINLTDKKTIFMTIHRRENIGGPMKNIFNAVKRLALQYKDQIQIIYAVHLNPAVTEPAHKILGSIGNIYLIDPLDVEDTHNLMNKSYFILTDSGGLQEEAPALGKPVLVCRTETERPEAVEAGTVKIVGVDENNIYNEAVTLIEDKEEYNKMAKAVNPYGDGQTSKRIVNILKEYFSL